MPIVSGGCGTSVSLTDDTVCCLTTHSVEVMNDEELNMSSSNCTKLVVEHTSQSGLPSGWSCVFPVTFNMTFEDPKRNTVWDKKYNEAII